MHIMLISITAVVLDLISSAKTTEITSQVFGGVTKILPAAFGDFNSDELTDLFVLHNNFKTIEVLIGSNEAEPLLKASNLNCTFTKCNITSVVPGDFNGDALMDVLITSKCPDFEKSIFGIHVLWGNQNFLNCSFDEDNPILQIRGEPLAIDCNNDFIIDLFGVNKNGQRGIWLFNNVNSTPDFIALYSTKDKNGSRGKVREPHSHSYLDLNNDNIADLFLTMQNQESYYFEEWHGKTQSPEFTFYKKIIALNHGRCKLGQSLFLDVELQGKMDLIVPVLDKTNPKILAYARDAWHDLNVNFKNEGNVWHFLEGGLPFSKAVILRGGDYNMDGYPDLLATLTSKNLNRTFLFENVACTHCKNFSRTFQIQWNGFSVNYNDTVGGVFYDFFQDGILDAILIRQYLNGSYHVVAIKNNLDYDVNFIKVMVLTGLTNTKLPNTDGALGKRKKTFGTNLPGPRIAYKTVDQDGFLRTGISAQLPQSAYFALNLPYIMFALGRTPNFVDNITVGFGSQHRDLPQVIPNSQMVVIPIQIDNPAKWKVQLFVTPSKIIVLSGMALVGTCFFITIIILILHWKEKKMDRLERLQEAYRFNFDAM